MVDPYGSLRRNRGVVLLVMLTLLALVAVLLAIRAFDSPSSPAATQVVRPLSETPGSSNAALFSTAADPSADFAFIKGQLDLQHYSVDEFTNLNGKATAGNFKSILVARRGILVAGGDGAPGFLAVETRTDAGSCAQAVSVYLASATFMPGDVVCHDRMLGMTAQGIRNAFRDSDTIVYLSACDSLSLQPSFTNARDFVGYQGCGGDSVSPPNDRKFWGRLAGTTDDGRSRSTMVAADRRDYGPRWTFRHRPATLDTVLSPSVAQVVPAPGSVHRVAGSTSGRVVFDSRMDQSQPAAELVSVAGCDAAITDPHWLTTASGYGAVDFVLQMRSPGTAILTIRAASARAARDFQNTLDGNQDPVRTDGVGPNGDSYLWSIACIPGNGLRLPITAPPEAEPSTSPLPVASVTTPPTTAPSSGSGTGTGGGGGGGGGATVRTTAPSSGGGGGGGTGGGTGGGPTCGVSAFRDSPPPAMQTATVQSSVGLASISGIQVSNGTVSVQGFAVGTTSAVAVTATKLDQTKPTQWSFDATDLVGRTTHCQ